ncbi:hypothetical protein BC829DRAFT_465547 [Chytridium lagenaria]|nr:hypothetical protein BC829DRAFT_465547 [Chytridium lagenaria]
MLSRELVQLFTGVAGVKRIVTLLMSASSLLCAGSLFAFGSFSEDLRDKLGFSSKDINVVSSLGNTALFCLVVANPSLFINITFRYIHPFRRHPSTSYTSFLLVGPVWDRFGVRVTMMMSAATFGLGFFLMYLGFQGLPASMSGVGAISLYYFLAGFGSCARVIEELVIISGISFMATFAVNLINFPTHYSGVMSGVLGIFYALSATLYAQIYAIYYSSDTAGFLLFMAFSVSLVNFIAMFAMSTRKTLNENVSKPTEVENIDSTMAEAQISSGDQTCTSKQDLESGTSEDPNTTSVPVDDPDAINNIFDYPARFPPIYCPAPPLTSTTSRRHSPSSSRSRSPSTSSWRNRSRSRTRTPSVFTTHRDVDETEQRSLSRTRSNMSLSEDEVEDEAVAGWRRRASGVDRQLGVVRDSPAPSVKAKRHWRGPREEDDDTESRDTPLPAAQPDEEEEPNEHASGVSGGGVAVEVNVTEAAPTEKRVAFSGEEPTVMRAVEREVKKGEELARDMTPIEILRSVTFWLLTVSYIWQQGITYFNNIGTIVKVLAGPNESPAAIAATTGFHVTLLSVSNCIARLTFGAGSDYIVRLGVDRSSLLLVSEILTFIPLAIVGFASTLPPSLLGFSSVLTGFAFGAASALFPPLTADFFGLKHYGSACALVMVGIPIGLVVSNKKHEVEEHKEKDCDR